MSQDSAREEEAEVANLRAETGLADVNALIAAEQLRDLRENRDERADALRTKARADRMRELLFGAGVLLIVLGVIGFAVMAVQASRSRAVIVETFDVPTAMALAGVTGKSTAADVLDAFTRVQGAVRAAVPKRYLGNAWTQEIEIELPKTGVSITQVNRLLKRWLAHDTHIGGSLVAVGAGRFALTVRGTTIPARRFEGTATELPNLSNRAAEYLFGEAEPALMGVYLVQQGRNAEADRFIAGHLARVDDPQRVRMLGDWASALDALGRHAEAIDKLRAALRIDHYAFARWDLLTVLLYPVAGPEAAVTEARRVIAAWDAAPPGKRPPEIEIQNSLILANDIQRVARATEEDNARTSGGSSLADNRMHLLENAVLLHDYDTAQRLQAQLDLSSRDMRAAILALGADRRADRGDLIGAAPLYDRARQLTTDPAKRTAYVEKLATTLSDLGRAAEASAILAALPADPDFFVRVIRARAGAGDVPATEATFRTLTAAAPSVADGWVAWGQARLAAGNYRGAAQAFARATTFSPRWADGWEGCGRARAAQGNWTGAADCYAHALDYAPAWPGLAARLAAARARAGN